jgi:hypothetical protein
MEELLTNNRIWRARLTNCWFSRFLVVLLNTRLRGVIARKLRFPWGFTANLWHMKFMIN